MAEAVVEWVATAIVDAIGIEGVAALAAAVPYVAVAASVYTLREQQRRAKSAYNNGLQDRYVMQRTATGQRQLVLGRARVSGPVTFLQSYGNNRTTLAMCVVLAAHECDGIEDIYFNDTPLVLDGSGNVVGTKAIEHYSLSGTTGTITLAAEAKPSTVTAVATYDTGDVTLGVSVAGDGRTVTLSGGTAGKVASVVATYRPKDVVYTPDRFDDKRQQQTATGSSGTFTVEANAIASSMVCVGVSNASVTPGGFWGYTITGVQTQLSISVSGTTVTYSGATAGQTVVLSYQAGSTYSRARIRQYLGAPGQTADSGLISNLPGLWTSNHVGAGLCYLVVELDYDPSAFPSGVPNVSAVVRGAKVYDPRTSTTAWSDNPALLARAYYLHPLGAARSTSEINDASVIAAANVCDQSVTYTVGTHKRTTARYKAATVAAKDRRPQDVLTDLCQAMGGRWVISGNQLTLKAGAYTSPVASIDETWLHNGAAVSIQPRPNRSDLVNAMVGTFADEEQAWQSVNYPKQAPAAYKTADGAELQTRVDFPAVTYVGQAQYLASCQIRYGRAGLTVKLSCNLRAFPLEVFDVVSVSLARFGWAAKTFEVLATAFTVDGLIELTLKEIDSTIWALDSAYNATDYAQKTLLPSPWFLAAPILGTPASGTAYLLKQADGTITSRIYVPITAITDQAVVQGGRIEIAYARIGDANWTVIEVPGDATSALLPNVQDGQFYNIKARAKNALAEGNWSQQIVHQVQGKTVPPSTPTGVTATIIPGAVRIVWDPCPDVDYDYTILKYGSSWAGGATLPFNRPGSSYDWLWPNAGTYTVWVAHVDTSGNVGARVTVNVTVDSSILIGASGINPPAGWINSNITLNADGSISGAGGGQVTNLPVPDTRSVNTPPNGYGTVHIKEFKQQSAIGVGSSGYCVLETIKGWPDSSGGQAMQWAYIDSGTVYKRSAAGDASSWGAWVRDLDRSTYTGDLNATSDLVLVADGAITIAGNAVTKGSSSGGWDASVRSRDSFTGGAYVSWLVDSAVPRHGFGLNTDPTTNASYDSIDYWLYVTDGAELYVYNNGAVQNSGSAIGTVAGGDVLAVTYDGSTVRYLKNGAVLFSQAATVTSPLFLDSSFYTTGGKASNIRFGPLTSNAWASIGGSGKPADNATRNVVTYSSSAPGSPVDGDLWVDTSGTYAVFKLRSGGAWVTGANALSAYNALSGKPVALADINTTESTKLAGIATGATRNVRFRQSTDPAGSANDGDLWLDTGTGKAWERISGVWQPYVGNGSVDTGQLAASAATTVYEVTDSTRRYFDSINWTSQPAYAGNELRINSIGPFEAGTRLVITATMLIEVVSHASSFFDAALYYFQYQQPPYGTNATPIQQTNVAAGLTDKRTVSFSQSITWPSGATASLAMSVWLNLGVAASSAEAYVSNSALRIEVIKR